MYQYLNKNKTNQLAYVTNIMFSVQISNRNVSWLLLASLVRFFHAVLHYTTILVFFSSCLLTAYKYFLLINRTPSLVVHLIPSEQKSVVTNINSIISGLPLAVDNLLSHILTTCSQYAILSEASPIT